MTTSKEKVKNFLNNLAIITSGMALTSLWITQSDNWKLYLLVCLSCIVFGQVLNLKK